MSDLSDSLRRLFCGHNSREQTVTPTRGNGWTGTITETRCLDCGKDLR